MSQKILGIRRIFLVAPIFLISCANKVVTFKTNEPAKVWLLQSGKLDVPADPLGDTPLTVNVKDLEGKVVRILQPGGVPVYWIVTDSAAAVTEANINLIPDPSAAPEQAADRNKSTPAALNRLMRVVMKSYQALSGRRFDAARDLADQAAALSPELAAPHVIKGLSFYQEGRLNEAKSTLAKAQALDPDDKDITELLTAIGQ